MSFKSENVIYKKIVMEESDENELDETVSQHLQFYNYLT